MSKKKHPLMNRRPMSFSRRRRSFSGLSSYHTKTSALGEFLGMDNTELKQHGMSLAAGAGAIIAGSTVLGMYRPELTTEELAQIADPNGPFVWKAPKNLRRIKAAVLAVAGLAAGAMLYRRGDKETAAAIVGGAAGLGVSELIASYTEMDASGPDATAANYLPMRSALRSNLNSNPLNGYPDMGSFLV